MDDLISRQVAIEALWKALYEYEDETEKRFIDSEELDVGNWIAHRIFVQNMSDIDRQTILNLPPVQQKVGKWVHGREIAREMVGDAITAIFYEGWQCSECKCIVEEEREPLWKFCPNCGAKMEEQDADQDTN